MSCLNSGNEYSLTSQVNKINHESMAEIDDVVHIARVCNPSTDVYASKP